MIIKKMTATFGCLQGAEMELHDGLNIISAPNESGKSTWCAFIRAMLYGIDTAQREKGGVKPDKLKFAPWSGEAMSGEMEIVHGDKAITLRRSTKTAAAPMREFSATYSGSAEVVPGLKGTDAGLVLTGMPKPVFESSVFVRQSGLGVANSPELEKRINAIISTGDEEAVSYTDADERLRAWLRKRRHNRSGAIPALEAEIDEKREALGAMAAAVAERERLQSQLLSAAEAERSAAETAEEQSSLRRRQAIERVETLRRELAETEQRRAEAMEKAMRAESETEMGHFGGMSASEALFEAGKDADLLTELRSKVPKHWLLLPIAFALVGLAFILTNIFTFNAIYLHAVGMALIICGLVVYLVRRGKIKEASAYAFAIVQRYNATDGEGIMAVAEEHVCACAAAEKANEALEAAEAELSRARSALHEAEDALLHLGSGGGESPYLARVREEAAFLRRRLALTEGRLEAMGDPMVTATEKAALESRKAELGEQYEALSLAIETLREANTELQQRFSPALGRRAGEIMARLTGGKYAELSFDRSLDATAKRSGDTIAHERAFLSEGTADQLYLALRLAICELALPEGCSCPLVLDDALVNFDDERMGYALELLREIAKERQVILFSCHDRERKYLES